MSEDEEDRELESRLRGFLDTELNGQLGRARQAFEKHLASGTASPAPRRGRRFIRTWTIGLVGTAAAASLAALWATPALRQAEPAGIAMTQPVPDDGPADVVATDSLAD